MTNKLQNVTHILAIKRLQTNVFTMSVVSVAKLMLKRLQGTND